MDASTLTKPVAAFVQKRFHAFRLFLRGLRASLSLPLIILFTLLVAGAITFQVWTAVHLSRDAVYQAESQTNRTIALSFAQRLGRFSERGTDREISAALNELSALNPGIRVYLANEHGIIVFSPAAYGRVRLPFVNLRPVLDFIANRDSPELILGDDPHNLSSTAPISATRLRLKGEQHYVYVVLAAASTAHAESFLGVSFWTLLVALLTAGLLAFILLFVAHRRVQGLQSSVAALSHDLRAPLSSIQGYLETIMSRGGQVNSGDAQRYMSVALRSTRSATNMVNDLHHLAMLESSGEKVTMEPLSVLDLVMDTLMAAKPIADEKEISLAWDIPPGVPLVYGNTALLERFVRNLVENSIRYTPKGGRIEVVFVVLAQTVRVVITDSGVGIPEKELKKVSQSFFRASNTKSSTKGSGIGLAICAKIAKIHGSELRILSREQEGTSVLFEIPQAEHVVN